MEDLFRTMVPFLDSEWAQREEVQALMQEYAQLDIELLRRMDGEMRKIAARKVRDQEAMTIFRDRYYFSQGVQKAEKSFRRSLFHLEERLEKLKECDEEQPPLSSRERGPVVFSGRFTPGPSKAPA